MPTLTAATSMAALERAQPGLRESHRTDILREAEAICGDALRRDPDQPAALHLRGLLAARSGRVDFALACLQRAVTAEPANATYLSDLGTLLDRKGRLAEALAVHLRALALRPTDAELCRKLARTLICAGKLAEALAVYEEAKKLAPEHAGTFGEIGDVLWMQGRISASLELYNRSLQLAPLDVEVYRRLGEAHLKSRNWTPAIEHFRKGLELRPPQALQCNLHVGVGEALLALGSFQDAAQAFQQAVDADPKDARSCGRLASVLELLGRRGDTVGAWVSLGAALQSRGLFHDAAAAYRQALARKPNCLSALLRLGWTHVKLAELDAAVECFEAAVAIDSAHPLAHLRLGATLLMRGRADTARGRADTARGWQEFCWEHRLHGQRRFEQPFWDGSSFDGKTILVWTDLALGDSIQSLRHLPTVKALGGRVIVESPPTMRPIFERMPSVDCVVTNGAALPAFDLHVPLFALLRIFYEQQFGVPTPYILVDPQLKAAWRERLKPSNHLCVGIAWSGSPTGSNAHTRFTSLSTFAPLASVPGVRLISLQLGVASGELLAPPLGMRVERLLTESCSVADTAALMHSLDLVVSVDTLIVHLAGALGRPTWAVVPYSPAWWIWETSRDVSIWYPTLRVFRQVRAGDWPDVFERVRDGLVSLVRVHQCGREPSSAASVQDLDPQHA